MTALRLKRGTTTQLNSYTGPPGELTVDTTYNQLRLHNGTTAGGITIGDLTVTSVKTSAYNANVNELVRIDSTTGSFTITLPATPSDGARISFLDVANQCGTNPVLVAANGKTILGDSTGISLDANGAVLGLVFNNLTNNWSNFNMFSSSSFAVVDPAQNVTYVDDVFSTYTYTGTANTQYITNGINLSVNGGLIWTKNRNGARPHMLVDTVRGISGLVGLSSNSANSSNGGSDIVEVNTNGYALVNTYGDFNALGDTHVSWTFRKAPKFFDVVTWAGNFTSNRQIAHSLGVAPGLIIAKSTTSVNNWFVYHRSLSSANHYLKLQSTDAQVDGGGVVFSAADASTFSVNANINGSDTYVAYLFAHDTSANGMIQCGSFTSDGSGQSNSVTLGWEPQYIMYKNSSSTGSWIVIDSIRGMPVGDGANTKMLNPNSSNAEGVTYSGVTLTATGFSIAGLSGSATYIYMAIRRPNKPPTLGTQVYNAIARTGTNTTKVITGVGFSPDLIISPARTMSATTRILVRDRLRGTSNRLSTNLPDVEQTGQPDITSLDMDGMTISGNTGINGNDNWIDWFFKRAPGVFDIVCYTGTGITRTVAHNLGVAPQLILIKRRDSTTDWGVYPATTSGLVYLNQSYRLQASSSYWGDTDPTSTTFTVGAGYSELNFNNSTYVAYLFATKTGISKVGSYTGNGSNQTINCGFTTGARFILIKRTDLAGDWYVWDTARGIVAGNDPHLSLNTTAAEVTTDDSIDPDNSGFIVNQVGATSINISGGTYIFLAFA